MESSIDLGLLKNVVNTAPLPIAVYVGTELRIALANEAIVKIWGKGPAVIGKLYTEILPELSGHGLFEQAKKVFQTGIPFNAYNERVDIIVDGVLQKNFFNYSFSPVYNNEGKIFGVINTGTDVTALNMAKLTIEQAEYRLNLALDSADMGTYETNLEENTIFTSKRFNAIWDVSEPVTRGKLVTSIHPDDLDLRAAAHSKALTNGGNLSYEARVIHQDHSAHWIRVKGKVIFNEKNKPSTLIGIVQDITEQKLFSEQLELQVRKKTEELQRSNSDLLQFAHIVSHDLKEPARKIKVFNDLIKANPKNTIEESKTYLDKIGFTAQRMTLLIDGILDYSTLGATEYKIEAIDLNATIDNIATDLELIIQEKKAILVKDSFPEIEGVPILIQQLFYNLINNALKFSKVKEPPMVTISSKLIKIKGQTHIQITVKDNGIGISAANAEKIFDAFQRLHSKSDYEGNGLGLSLCKKITERHHGTINVVGEENMGTAFIVTLPLKQKSSVI